MSPWVVLAIKAGLNFVCSIVRPIYMVKLIQLDFKHYMKNVFMIVYLVAGLSIPLPMMLLSYCENDLIRLFVSLSSFIFMFSFVVYFIGLTDKEKMLAKDLFLSKLLRLNRID